MGDRPRYRLSPGQTESLVCRMLHEMADRLEASRPDRILTAVGRIASIQVTTMSPPLARALRAKAPEITAPITRRAYATLLREIAGPRGYQSSTQPGTRERVAELHRAANQDYADGAPAREGLSHYDAHLIAPAAEAAEAHPDLDEDQPR